MSYISTVTDLLNETAFQQSRDAQAAREASYRDENSRNVGGTMGKNDFLLLLATQLRYQNPLEPTSDADFAAQLAQFSSLEQMQNMNASLAAMASYQAYGLVGRPVYAQQFENGELVEYFGFVESVYTRKGITYAQIEGYEFGIPVSDILEVFDNSGFTTSDAFIQASGNLVGRSVAAQVGDETVEGVVTRLIVDAGRMYAFIDDGTEEQWVVPVSAIFDIRTTTAGVTSDEFIQTSSSLIGRSVAAKVDDDETVEGVVTRLVMEEGRMYAYIDDGSEEQIIVPVCSIYDIRMSVAGPPAETEPEDEPPPVTGVDPEDEPPPVTGVDPEDEPPPVTGTDPEDEPPPVTGTEPEDEPPPVTGTEPEDELPPVTGTEPEDEPPPVTGTEPEDELPPVTGTEPEDDG